MKLKKYKAGKTYKDEDVVQIAIQEAGDGCIEMVAYDNMGNPYNSDNHILDITEEGILIYSGFTEFAGFPQNSVGKVKRIKGY